MKEDEREREREREREKLNKTDLVYQLALLAKGEIFTKKKSLTFFVLFFLKSMMLDIFLTQI